MSPDGWLEALDEILTQIGWDSGPPFALAGCSLGGALAMRYAAHRPKRVARLTLVAPAGLPEPMWNAPFHLASGFVCRIPHPIFNITKTSPGYGLTPDAIASVAKRLGPAMRVVVAAYDLVHTPHVAFWSRVLPEKSVTLLPRTTHWWACTHLFGLLLHDEPRCWGREPSRLLSRL